MDRLAACDVAPSGEGGTCPRMLPRGDFQFNIFRFNNTTFPSGEEANRHTKDYDCLNIFVGNLPKSFLCTVRVMRLECEFSRLRRDKP